MQIALFGGTQGIGKQVVLQGLEQGHSLTVLARTPAKLAEISDSNLHIIEGDVLDPQSVNQTLAGADAVVCSLGTTRNNPDNVVSKGTSLITRGMSDLGIERLIVVTSLGVGDSRDQVPFLFKLLMKTLLRKVMADKEVQEAVVGDSGLAWTIVRPSGLVDGPKTGSYTSSTGQDLRAGRVARADVADFILQELQENEYLQQAVGVT